MNHLNYYCIYCLQNYEAKDFSLWLEDTTKARKCNGCSDKVTIEHNNAERELKRKAQAEELRQKPSKLPILKKLSETEESKRRVEVAKRLREKLDEIRLNDEVGI